MPLGEEVWAVQDELIAKAAANEGRDGAGGVGANDDDDDEDEDDEDEDGDSGGNKALEGESFEVFLRDVRRNLKLKRL